MVMRMIIATNSFCVFITFSAGAFRLWPQIPQPLRTTGRVGGKSCELITQISSQGLWPKTIGNGASGRAGSCSSALPTTDQLIEVRVANQPDRVGSFRPFIEGQPASVRAPRLR